MEVSFTTILIHSDFIRIGNVEDGLLRPEQALNVGYSRNSRVNASKRWHYEPSISFVRSAISSLNFNIEAD